jgi:hypothetical protein
MVNDVSGTYSLLVFTIGPDTNIQYPLPQHGWVPFAIGPSNPAQLGKEEGMR